MFRLRLLLHHKSFKIKRNIVVCSSLWFCIVKNDQKWPCSWGRESRKDWCHSYHFYSVDFYDLLITLKCQGNTYYQRPIGKINTSLLFRPSVISGPWLSHGLLNRWTSQYDWGITTAGWLERKWNILKISHITIKLSVCTSMRVTALRAWSILTLVMP